MYVQKKEILQPELQLLGSAQAHTPHFKKHDLKIYISCEYCHEFICKWCAKTDPQQEKRAMKKNLNKAEEDNMNEMDEKIKKAFKQVEDNKKCRD